MSSDPAIPVTTSTAFINAPEGAQAAPEVRAEEGFMGAFEFLVDCMQELKVSRIPKNLHLCFVDKGPNWGPFVSMPTVVLKSRVDRSNAAAARKVLSRLGLKPSDAINALFAQIASRKALPFSLATSDSSYASEEYGLNRKGIIAVGKNLRKHVEQERLEGTVRSVSSIADLRD